MESVANIFVKCVVNCLNFEFVRTAYCNSNVSIAYRILLIMLVTVTFA